MANRSGNMLAAPFSRQTPNVLTSINVQSAMAGVHQERPAPMSQVMKVTENVEAALVELTATGGQHATFECSHTENNSAF